MPYRIAQGQQLTDYVSVDIIVERVDSGGMGLVAFGPDSRAKGHVRALKTIRPDRLARSSKLRALFIQEALTWVSLWPHPNITTADFVANIDGIPFLVLHYAEHGSLSDLLEASRPHLPLVTAVEIAQQIAAGLIALHTPDPQMLRSTPIVHCDLKPKNLLISEISGMQFVQITDFGLAQVVQGAGVEEELPEDNSIQYPLTTEAHRTRRGVVFGTPAYMPPEQWEGKADCPADLYALGQILSELVTGYFGVAPSGWDTMEDWKLAHYEEMPKPLGVQGNLVPPELEALYQNLLSKKPEQRPTAKQAFAQLQKIAQGLGETPYSPPIITPHTSDEERKRWHNWSIVYYNFGLYDQALARSYKALALDPNAPEVLSNHGDILAMMGQKETALQFYTSALRCIPANDLILRNMVLHQMGLLMCDMGCYTEADAVYTKALTLMPENASTWYNRARNELQWAIVELEGGQMAEAKQHIHQSITFATRALHLNQNFEPAQTLLVDLHQLRAQFNGIQNI